MLAPVPGKISSHSCERSSSAAALGAVLVAPIDEVDEAACSCTQPWLAPSSTSIAGAGVLLLVRWE